MASTWTLTLFTMWMEYSFPHDVSKWFTIVDPLWMQLHERDFILILIVVSGHWVLWTKLRHKVSKLTNTLVHHKPLNNEAIGTLHSLANIGFRTISSAREDHNIVLAGRHRVLHIPTQPNGWGYGYYMMKTIHMLVEEFMDISRFCKFDCKWMSHLVFVNFVIIRIW